MISEDKIKRLEDDNAGLQRTVFDLKEQLIDALETIKGFRDEVKELLCEPSS